MSGFRTYSTHGKCLDVYRDFLIFLWKLWKNIDHSNQTSASPFHSLICSDCIEGRILNLLFFSIILFICQTYSCNVSLYYESCLLGPLLFYSKFTSRSGTCREGINVRFYRVFRNRFVYLRKSWSYYGVLWGRNCWFSSTCRVYLTPCS